MPQGRRPYNLLEKLLSGYCRDFADLPSGPMLAHLKATAQHVPPSMLDEIEARMLALGPEALAALLVLRFHDIVMRGAVFANATVFAQAILDDLRKFDIGSEALAEARGEIERRQKVVQLRPRC